MSNSSLGFFLVGVAVFDHGCWNPVVGNQEPVVLLPLPGRLDVVGEQLEVFRLVSKTVNDRNCRVDCVYLVND